MMQFEKIVYHIFLALMSLLENELCNWDNLGERVSHKQKCIHEDTSAVMYAKLDIFSITNVYSG